MAMDEPEPQAGRKAPEVSSQAPYGRTWADLAANIPLWLISLALSFLVVLIGISVFVTHKPLSLGILGDFGGALEEKPLLNSAQAELVMPLTAVEAVALISDFKGLRQCVAKDRLRQVHRSLIKVGYIEMIATPDGGCRGQDYALIRTPRGEQAIDATIELFDHAIAEYYP